MTKIEVNVIINTLEKDVLNGQARDESKEKVKVNIIPNLMNEQMKELHISLKNATEYLIDLFNQTGQRYSCTRTKLGKMLSIVAFKYARENIQVFDEDIYIYNGCGTIIEGMNAITEIAPYMSYKYQDDKQYIQDELNTIEFVMSEDANISDNVKRSIESVFRVFGSFSASELAKCINPIVNSEGITEEKGRVLLSKFTSLTRESMFGDEDAKELVDYLFNP